MPAFTSHTGIAVPLDRANVDTDQIIPKQFLRKIERTGFGVHLFHDWRFTGAEDDLKPDASFVLNAPRYEGASVLLARDNFGCGSSREHAPWALADYGFKVIIAPSFADIFYNNCFKNWILPVVLTAAEVAELFCAVEAQEGATITADLAAQTVTSPAGRVYKFSVDSFRKDCLLNGLDDISLTLEHEAAITTHEEKIPTTMPWLV